MKAKARPKKQTKRFGQRELERIRYYLSGYRKGQHDARVDCILLHGDGSAPEKDSEGILKHFLDVRP